MGAVIGILFVAVIAVGITLAASGNIPGDWTGFNLAGEGKVVIEPKGGLEIDSEDVPAGEDRCQDFNGNWTDCAPSPSGALDPLQILAEIEGVEQSRITCDSTAADPYCSVTFKIDLEVMNAWEEAK